MKARCVLKKAAKTAEKGRVRLRLYICIIVGLLTLPARAESGLCLEPRLAQLAVASIPGPVLKQLARAAYLNSSMRSVALKQFQKQYKNNPSFATWVDSASTVDDPARALREFVQAGRAPTNANAVRSPAVVELSDATVFQPATVAFQETVAAIPETEFRLPGFGVPLSYEERVLRLRKGDTVSFGRVRFVLGDFLGAGDATHIYAIEGRPDEVLRIPFMSIRGFSHNMTFAKKLIIESERMDNALPKSLLRARITQVDPEHRFLIAERVWGDLEGRDFIQAELDKPAGMRRDRRIAGLIKALLQSPESVRLDGSTRNNMMSGELPSDPDELRTVLRQARQYVWDRRRQAWILVDLELR